MAFDALGYLASCLSLVSINKGEKKKEPGLDDPPRDFFGEMREGIHVVTDNPILWRIAGSTATSNLGTNIVGAVFLIFAYDRLRLSPSVVGFIGTVGAVGFAVGVLLTGRITARLGVGMTLAVSIASGFAALANPLAQYAYPFLVLAAVGFATGLALPLYNINQVSLRQAITPDRLQGRMNATMRTIVWGTIPVGSLVAGVLGGMIGVVNTFYVGAIVGGMATLWILLGPVVRITEHPKPVTD